MKKYSVLVFALIVTVTLSLTAQGQELQNFRPRLGVSPEIAGGKGTFHIQAPEANKKTPQTGKPKEKPVYWTVTFDSDGGSAVASQKLEAGSLVNKPKDPSKAGFTFSGWYYTSPEYVTEFNFNDMRVNWDITLTAKWMPVSSKPAAKPDPKQDPKPTAKPDPKQDPKSPAKPNPKQDPKHAAKPDPKQNPKPGSKPVLTEVTPSAVVEKLTGNKNNLKITIIGTYSDGSTKEVANKTFSINNNAADTYVVGDYKVYVDTKGNTQIRACYIVN